MNKQNKIILVIIILVICAASLLAMPQLKQRFTGGAAAGAAPTTTEAPIPDREYPPTSARASRRGFDSSQPQIVEPGYNDSMGGQSQPSYEVLQQMKEVGPDGQRNLYFYTPEQARKMGLKKYTSGPCKGYYQGEEWWCK